MKETQTPAGRELSMPELYGEGPVAVHLRDIYALPGMPYGKGVRGELCAAAPERPG